MSATVPQSPTRQLLAFRFPPGSGFEGQLVGALERIESGGTLRIRGALFVAREPETGQLVAVTMSVGGQSGMISKLLSFRLDPGARQRVTDEALDSPLGPVLRSLADTVEPGAAVAAVLVEHAWSSVLNEAIDRIGGQRVLDTFIEADELAAVPDALAGIPAAGASPAA